VPVARALLRRRERPEREVGERDQPGEGDHAGGERHPDQFVTERDWPVAPEQEICGLAREEPRGIDVGDHDDEAGDERNGGSGPDERAHEDSRARAAMSDVERAATRPEHPGSAQ